MAIPLRRYRPFATRRLDSERLALTLVTLVVAASIVATIVAVLLRSFQEPVGLVHTVYSLSTYRSLLTGAMLRAALNTGIVSVGSALCATVIGTGIAWVVSRVRVRGSTYLELLNYFPFFVTPLILAIAWTYLSAPQNGLVNHALISLGLSNHAVLNIDSLPGLIWVITTANVPIVIMLTTAMFRQIDSALEDAGRISGSDLRNTFRITLPLAGPAIASAGTLAFVLALEELGAPLILGYPYNIQTLSTELYNSVNRTFPPNYEQAAALGCVMAVVAGVAFAAQRRYLGRRSYTTVTGKAGQIKPVRLPRWIRYLAGLLCAAYTVVAVVAPIVILVLAGLSRRWTGSVSPRLFTGQNFSYVFLHDPGAGRALLNSALLSVVTASVVVVLATLATYTTDRLKVRGAGLIDVTLSLPIAVGGLAIAVGVLALLLKSPLYATLWIIGIAYAIRYFPYAHRSISASMRTIHQETADASSICGGGRFTTLRRVIIPLLRQGMWSGWLLLFIMFMREVSMSNLLWTPGTQTLSVQLYNAIAYQPAGVAAAFTVVQTVILLIPAAIVIGVTRRHGQDVTSIGRSVL